jgi:uncharacterized membrane protein YecN with MAPEG domain
VLLKLILLRSCLVQSSFELCNKYFSLHIYNKYIYYIDFNLFFQCIFHINFANTTNVWFYCIILLNSHVIKYFVQNNGLHCIHTYVKKKEWRKIGMS